MTLLKILQVLLKFRSTFVSLNYPTDSFEPHVYHQLSCPTQTTCSPFSNVRVLSQQLLGYNIQRFRGRAIVGNGVVLFTQSTVTL